MVKVNHNLYQDGIPRNNTTGREARVNIGSADYIIRLFFGEFGAVLEY